MSLACLDKNGVLLDDDLAERFKEIPEFPLTSFYDFNLANQLRRFVGYIKTNRIDIVQTHDFYTNIFGMIGARMAAVPIRIAAKRETGMRTRTQRFIERRAFGLADVIVVNSSGVKDYLAGSGVPSSKLAIVFNGIDLDRFTAIGGDRTALAELVGLPIEPHFRFVTIVANLREPVKNHEMFLRAASKVSGCVPDAAFVIAGEGERTRLITSAADDLGLSDRTFFLGRCMHVPELLALSDVCVLTSDSEGFSNSILEYMAAGKPVVATDVGGASEAILENETGFLVARNDHESLAERICRLLNDQILLDELGRKGRERVAEQFSLETQLAATLAIYEQELRRLSGARRSSYPGGGRMRIVQLGPMPPPHGGVATNMLAIHEALTSCGHRSTIVDVTNRKGRQVAANVLKPRSAFGLVKMLARLDCDIVHFHIGGDFSLKLAFLTLFCGLLPKKKSVVTFHSGGYARDAVNTATPRSLRGAAFRSVDMLIGVNEQMIKMFRSFGVDEKLARLILPFELKRPDPSVKIPIGLEDFIGKCKPFLLSVGALQTEYRNDFLIKAMPSVVERFPAAGLLIVGAGDIETELKRDIASSIVAERMMIAGDVPHPVVLHLIDRADALIRITEYDGDSIAVREALFLGTPVIASDNVNRPKGVILLDSRLDPNELVGKLIKAEEAQFAGQSDASPEGGNAARVVEVYKQLLEG